MPHLGVKVGVNSDDSSDMNATAHVEHQGLGLVDIIDFKWLMRGEGLNVHVERLQSDPAYALRCLEVAGQSANDAVRDAAARVRRFLGVK